MKPAVNFTSLLYIMPDEISVRNAVDSLIDSLHEWLTQLVWYPGCEVTSIADADDGYIVCQISGGTNQQCGWKKLFSIAVGDFVDVLYDPRSMRWEVFKPGGSVIWSSSSWNLGSDCIRAAYTNNATGTLSLGEVVVFDATLDYAVTTTTSTGDIDVAGVVLVGGASGSLVQVAVLGRAPVYVDGNVTRGQFLKTSSARGFATPTATFDQGVFGVALTANAAGSSGTVDAFLVGHCWEGAGGGGGGNTLDQAYDQGGAGAGRTITADSGAVQINGAGGLGSEGNIVLDDGDGDSPQIQLVGGSNDDTGYIFLDDDAVAGRSDLIIKLPGSDNQSILDIQNSAGTTVVNIDCAGNMNVYAVGGIPGTFRSATALTNVITEVWRLIHTTSGIPAAGFGDRLGFFADNDNNMAVTIAAIDAIWDDPAAGSEDSRIALGVRVGGAALAEICRVDGNGILMVQNKLVDLAGGADALVLDNDGDTTISAPSDDQIDIEISGADDFTFTANSFNVLSSSYITMASGAWIGLGAASARIEFYAGEVDISDCNVGIGLVPTNIHLAVGDVAVNTAASYTGLYAAHTKTAGASDHDDDFIGIAGYAALNQSGGEVGELRAVQGTCVVADGNVGDASNARSAYGGKFLVQATGGTIHANAIGFYCPAEISGGTVSGNVYGAYAYADLNSGSSVGGAAYGAFIVVDDDVGVTAYGLYLWELTGVNYGVYQNGTADNAFGGNILPTGNKAKNLGAAGNRWNTLYQGTSTAAGTSRLIQSTRDCPICKQPMVRGTGSLCVLGEDRDFVLAHCLNCGNVAMEEHQHLPTQALAKRRPPPCIEFVGFEVFEMSGNSRSVRVDFRYTDDETETFTDPNGKEREMVKKPGITNSTYLSDAELDTFLAMSAAKRKNYLLHLGQREWDALEDTRLMQEECANLKAQLNKTSKRLMGKNLLKEKK